jgi:hypothetical protein
MINMRFVIDDETTAVSVTFVCRGSSEQKLFWLHHFHSDVKVTLQRPTFPNYKLYNTT